jgi:hypothetical protein
MWILYAFHKTSKIRIRSWCQKQKITTLQTSNLRVRLKNHSINQHKFKTSALFRGNHKCIPPLWVFHYKIRSNKDLFHKCTTEIFNSTHCIIPLKTWDNLRNNMSIAVSLTPTNSAIPHSSSHRCSNKANLRIGNHFHLVKVLMRSLILPSTSNLK